MSAWAPQVRRQTELDKTEALLKLAPGDPGLLFQKATLLHALGRLDDAKNAYVGLLRSDPSHLGALDQLGSILHGTNYRSAAITVYKRLAGLLPGSAMPLVHLGNVLWDHDDHAGARARYEEALGLDPACPGAHQGMAAVFNELRQAEAALDHARQGFAAGPALRIPYRGDAEPVPILVLGSAAGGNIPLRKAIDDRVFQATVLAVEFQDPAKPLPAHRIVWNAIGEADHCGPALKLAEGLLKRTRAPVINPPDRVAKTGRSANAARLAGVAGLRVPKTLPFSRELLEGPDAPAALAAAGFRFPLLVRAQGFHAGEHFEKIGQAGALKGAVESMPGRDFMAIEFMDARHPDGWIRKYRAMAIDGRLYPLHAAVSRHWKIHYFSADMAGNAANRAEDEAFLDDMAGTLGNRAMAALQSVVEALGLDYAGIDFGLDAGQSVLFYEANATMIVAPPDAGEQWDYRRAPVQRVLDAVTAMLLSRKGS